MKRALLAVCAFLTLCGAASAQYTAVTGTKFLDAGGNPLATGSITFFPTDLQGNPLQVQLGGGGQVLPRAAVCLISAGAITTSQSGTACQVVDSTLSNPRNFCYKVVEKDTVLNQTFPALPCVQVGGATFSFDNYVQPGPPNSLIVTGPTGTSFVYRGQWTPNTLYISSPTEIDTVSYSGTTYAATSTFTSGASFATTNLSIFAQGGGVQLNQANTWTAPQTLASYPNPEEIFVMKSVDVGDYSILDLLGNSVNNTFYIQGLGYGSVSAPSVEIDAAAITLNAAYVSPGTATTLGTSVSPFPTVFATNLGSGGAPIANAYIGNLQVSSCTGCGGAGGGGGSLTSPGAGGWTSNTGQLGVLAKYVDSSDYSALVISGSGTSGNVNFGGVATGSVTAQPAFTLDAASYTFKVGGTPIAFLGSNAFQPNTAGATNIGQNGAEWNYGFFKNLGTGPDPIGLIDVSNINVHGTLIAAAGANATFNSVTASTSVNGTSGTFTNLTVTGTLSAAISASGDGSHQYSGFASGTQTTPNVDAFGDSYMAGTGASGPTTKFIAVATANQGWTYTDHAVGGAGIFDQTPYAYSTAVSPNSYSVVYMGDNGIATVTPAWYASYQQAYLAIAAYRAIPDTGYYTATGQTNVPAKVHADNTAFVTQGGGNSWTSNSDSRIAFGLKTLHAGDTLTFRGIGSGAVVGFRQTTASNYTACVTINGVAQPCVSPAMQYADSTDNNGYSATEAGAAFTYPAGAASRELTVTILCQVPGTSGCLVDWIGTNGAAALRQGPFVWTMGPTGSSSTSQNSTGVNPPLNDIVRHNADLLGQLHLNVDFVDVMPLLDFNLSPQLINTANSHPNDAGHALMAQALTDRWSATVGPRDRAANWLASSANPIVFGSGAPPASCSIPQTGNIYERTDSYGRYECLNQAWTALPTPSGGPGVGSIALTNDVSASGSGTVAAQVVGINGTNIQTMTGIPKFTSGVIGVAVPGTDYVTPGGTVANATNATTAANLSGSITGGQVSSAVANATNAVNAANATNATNAATAASLSGSIPGTQVSSAVANATNAVNATNATNATNLAGGSLGAFPYQSSAGTTAFLAANTSAAKCFFSETGTGSAGAAPACGPLATADVPVIGANTQFVFNNAGVMSGTSQLVYNASGAFNASTPPYSASTWFSVVAHDPYVIEDYMATTTDYGQGMQNFCSAIGCSSLIAPALVVTRKQGTLPVSTTIDWSGPVTFRPETGVLVPQPALSGAVISGPTTITYTSNSLYAVVGGSLANLPAYSDTAYSNNPIWVGALGGQLNTWITGICQTAGTPGCATTGTGVIKIAQWPIAYGGGWVSAFAAGATGNIYGMGSSIQVFQAAVGSPTITGQNLTGNCVLVGTNPATNSIQVSGSNCSGSSGQTTVLMTGSWTVPVTMAYEPPVIRMHYTPGCMDLPGDRNHCAFGGLEHAKIFDTGNSGNGLSVKNIIGVQICTYDHPHISDVEIDSIDGTEMLLDGPCPNSGGNDRNSTYENVFMRNGGDLNMNMGQLSIVSGSFGVTSSTDEINQIVFAGGMSNNSKSAAVFIGTANPSNQGQPNLGPRQIGFTDGFTAEGGSFASFPDSSGNFIGGWNAPVDVIKVGASGDDLYFNTGEINSVPYGHSAIECDYCGFLSLTNVKDNMGLQVGTGTTYLNIANGANSASLGTTAGSITGIDQSGVYIGSPFTCDGGTTFYYITGTTVGPPAAWQFQPPYAGASGTNAPCNFINGGYGFGSAGPVSSTYPAQGIQSLTFPANSWTLSSTNARKALTNGGTSLPLIGSAFDGTFCGDFSGQQYCSGGFYMGHRQVLVPTDGSGNMSMQFPGSYNGTSGGMNIKKGSGNPIFSIDNGGDICFGSAVANTSCNGDPFYWLNASGNLVIQALTAATSASAQVNSPTVSLIGQWWNPALNSGAGGSATDAFTLKADETTTPSVGTLNFSATGQSSHAVSFGGGTWALAAGAATFTSTAGGAITGSTVNASGAVTSGGLLTASANLSVAGQTTVANASASNLAAVSASNTAANTSGVYSATVVANTGTYATSGNLFLTGFVSGNTYPSIGLGALIDSSAAGHVGIGFGPGTGAFDVHLYRYSSTLLRTDASFQTLNLTLQGASGNTTLVSGSTSAVSLTTPNTSATLYAGTTTTTAGLVDLTTSVAGVHTVSGGPPVLASSGGTSVPLVIPLTIATNASINRPYSATDNDPLGGSNIIGSSYAPNLAIGNTEQNILVGVGSGSSNAVVVTYTNTAGSGSTSNVGHLGLLSAYGSTIGFDGTGAVTMPTSVSTAVLKNTAAQTTSSCSSSGTVVFSEPEQGSSYKKVVIYEFACNGTVSYTYPTAFAHTPEVISQSLAGTVGTPSTTSVTVTGSTSTGVVILDAY